MNKKIFNNLYGLLALVCLPVLALAQTGYNGAADGAWDTPTTWNPNGRPGTAFTEGNEGDSAYIGTQGGNNITLDVDVGTLNSTYLYRTAVTTLTLNDGANMTPNLFQIERGTATVNTGATVTAPSYLAFGNGAPNNTVNTLSINGGTVNTGLVYFGGLDGTDITTNLEVLNGGAFVSTGQVIFNSQNGGISDFKVTSGTASVPYFQFEGQVGDSEKTGLLRTVTVDGGDLTVTNADAAVTFNFGSLTSTQAYLEYNGGSIIWQGVNTLAEFNSLIDTFNLAVDSGYITSASLTPEELKYQFQFIGGDAVLSLAPKAFPVIEDPLVNLLSNGDFLLTANEDDTANPGAFEYNVNGTFGDFLTHELRTADVVDWAPYYEDPDNLVPAVGEPHFTGDGTELDGTWYLDTLIDTNSNSILLNSSMNYRNGMKQEDILNGITIDSGKSYTLSVNAVYNLGDEITSPLTVALTDGSGAEVTNLANAIPGSLLTTAWNGVHSTTVSGADLLAAGQVNVIFDLVNSTEIPGFPGDFPDPLDISLLSQVRVYSVLLGETFIQQPGDMNKDGVVNQADVDLANSYLDGSIDGPLGYDAVTAQAILVGEFGFTDSEALAALNLTPFDINGNGTFDGADVSALQAILSPSPTILSAVKDGSSFHVEVSGLTIGTGYSLLKDADLGSLPSFNVIADSITAASETETLTDTNAVDDQAFYKIVEDQ